MSAAYFESIYFKSEQNSESLKTCQCPFAAICVLSSKKPQKKLRIAWTFVCALGYVRHSSLYAILLRKILYNTYDNKVLEQVCRSILAKLDLTYKNKNQCIHV